MSKSLIPSFLVSDVSESLRSLTKNERMSESLIFLSESLIRSFLGKNERFARKTDEQIPRPDFSQIFLLLLYFYILYCTVLHTVLHSILKG